MDFDILAENGVKLKESLKRNQYFDLASEQKKLRNMKVTVIPIVIGVLGTVPKGLESRLEELEIRGRMETIQTTASLESSAIEDV